MTDVVKKPRFVSIMKISPKACIVFGSDPPQDCSVCHYPSKAWAYSKKLKKHFCSHCFPAEVRKDRLEGGKRFPHVRLKGD